MAGGTGGYWLDLADYDITPPIKTYNLDRRIFGGKLIFKNRAYPLICKAF
jgi:hypothetical protein